MIFGLTVLALSAAQAAPAASAPAPPGPTPPRLRSGWISNADYPRAALRVRAQGRAVALFTVTPQGTVASCRITTSSGNEALDAVSPQIGVERFTFTPARDAAGRPVEGRYEQPFTWRLPH